MIALKHFRRPEVEVVGDEVTVVSMLLEYFGYHPFQRMLP